MKFTQVHMKVCHTLGCPVAHRHWYSFCKNSGLLSLSVPASRPLMECAGWCPHKCMIVRFCPLRCPVATMDTHA